MSVESPEYEVVRQEGVWELCRYRPYLTASVKTRAAGHSEATCAGFGLLADHISGNNVEAGITAMTAPVTASRSAGPSRFESVKDLPRPNDPRVTQLAGDKRCVRRTKQSLFDSIVEEPLDDPVAPRAFLVEYVCVRLYSASTGHM